MSGWKEGFGPTDPVIIDDKLYGRGASDDGYSTFAAVLAIKALQEQHIPHPRCVLLIEGCEESASRHIESVIDAKIKEIGDVSLVFVLDSGCLDYENMWVTSTLRGNVKMIFKVKVLKEGVHSGDASGIVPSSFRILRKLLDRVDDVDTGEVN